jgi:hypothetical protein
MDYKTGRADHIEDYLAYLHTGQWFGWSDSKNKVYANLIIHLKIQDENNDTVDNPHSKPTEQECTDGLEQLQSEYDALDYARKRKAEYPSISELVVALYDTEDKAAIEAKRAEIKIKYPKP